MSLKMGEDAVRKATGVLLVRPYFVLLTFTSIAVVMS